MKAAKIVHKIGQKRFTFENTGPNWYQRSKAKHSSLTDNLRPVQTIDDRQMALFC